MAMAMTSAASTPSRKAMTKLCSIATELQLALYCNRRRLRGAAWNGGGGAAVAPPRSRGGRAKGTYQAQAKEPSAARVAHVRFRVAYRSIYYGDAEAPNVTCNLNPPSQPRSAM